MNFVQMPVCAHHLDYWAKATCSPFIIPTQRLDLRTLALLKPKCTHLQPLAISIIEFTTEIITCGEDKGSQSIIGFVTFTNNWFEDISILAREFCYFSRLYNLQSLMTWAQFLNKLKFLGFWFLIFWNLLINSNFARNYDILSENEFKFPAHFGSL